MGNAMMNALIAAGVVFAIGYGWFTHLQNRGRRSRAATGGDGGGGDSYSGTSNGVSLGSWFSSDSSGSATDGGSCSSKVKINGQPTIVKGTLLIRIRRPTASGAPSIRRRQYASLMTATG